MLMLWVSFDLHKPSSTSSKGDQTPHWLFWHGRPRLLPSLYACETVVLAKANRMTHLICVQRPFGQQNPLNHRHGSLAFGLRVKVAEKTFEKILEFLWYCTQALLEIFLRPFIIQNHIEALYDKDHPEEHALGLLGNAICQGMSLSIGTPWRKPRVHVMNYVLVVVPLEYNFRAIWDLDMRVMPP